MSIAFDFNTIENYILSPGDIFWVKKSGEEVLVSKKGELANLLLIKKLIKNEMLLEMRDEINIDVVTLLQEYFEKSKKELLVKNKIFYRNKIIEILYAEYATSERTQYEFDIMVWKIFSKFKPEEQMSLVLLDMDLFKRSLRVCSSLVISSYLVGYYDEKFLELLFEKTMMTLMNIVPKNTFSEDISKLDKLRNDINSVSDIGENVKSLFDPTLLSSEIGSWEKILIVYNLHFSFEEESTHINILNKLLNKKIKILANELKTAIRVLTTASNNIGLAELA